MIKTIILIALIIIGNYMYRDGRNEALGFVIAFMAVVLAIAHSFLYIISKVEYELFIEERDTYVSSLEYTKELNSKYQLDEISRSVALWNDKLASIKRNKTIIIIGDYIDDRFDSLEPIR